MLVHAWHVIGQLLEVSSGTTRLLAASNDALHLSRQSPKATLQLSLSVEFLPVSKLSLFPSTNARHMRRIDQEGQLVDGDAAPRNRATLGCPGSFLPSDLYMSS